MRFRIFETVYSRPARVDREQGILYGCKLLGRTSRNGREYSDKAMKEAAARYAALGIDLDHKRDPKQDRSLRDLIAVRPRNVKVTSEGVYGDVHLLLSDPYAQKLLEAADKDPAVFGFSHEADLKGRKDKGKVYVESVTRVHSLDLVRHPATTRGAFESEDMMTETTIQEAQDEQPADCYTLLAQAMAAAQAAGDTDMAQKIHKLLKPQASEAPAAGAPPVDQQAPQESAKRGLTEAEVAALAKSLRVAAAAPLQKALAGRSVAEALEVFESIRPTRGSFSVPERAAPNGSSREERVNKYKS